MELHSGWRKIVTRVTQQHVDARRESIVESATRLFARKGVAGATMAEIAAEAGISAGAIYRYFSSKEELLRGVFDDAMERNQEIFSQIEQQATSPLDALVQIGHTTWVNHTDRDALICEIQMALSAAREPEDFGVAVAEMYRFIREMLVRLIKKAQTAGEIDQDVDPETLAVILHSSTAGIQMMKLTPNQRFDVEAAFNLLVEMTVSLGRGRRNAKEG
jgi:TetR/AcrR family transcriptional regulator, transcriptional repressor of aconitase